MKKFIQLVSAAVVTFTVGFVPAVSAATDCSITNTGPGSTNTCIVNDSNLVTVTCVNGVQAASLNNQTAFSGTATVSGNTVSANALSGSAANVNTAATALALNCAAAPAASTTPATTPTSTTSAGRGGGGAVQGAATQKVTALPKTGPNTLASVIALSTAGVGSLAALSHAGLSAYRRRAFKA